ncbi:MAG: ATP synthase subunit C [Treponema sp.]|nr:ATP synthase subunit C [Treponema sp.]
MKCRVVIVIFILLALSMSLAGQEAAVEAGERTSAGTENTAIWKYFAAAAAVGISCIAGGIAVGQIGAAAMGAMSENSELSGKALPYAGLAEGICLWGFLVALLILIL